MKALLLAIIAIFISSGISCAQDIILKLQPGELPAQERNYRFDQLLDTRGRKEVGRLFDAQRKAHSLTFDGKLAEQTLALYRSKIKPTHAPSHNILVKIHTLDQSEIYQADWKAYKGEIELKLGFFLIGPNEPEHLVDFQSKTNYRRPINQPHHIEPAVRSLFENGWKYFDDWISAQSMGNRLLAKKVRLNIIDPVRKSTADTVFYDPGRPLTWDDFKESPSPLSSFNATIFSSLSIEGNATVEDGEIIQNIEIKVYMIPAQSWVKHADSYASNHEQRHFDITRIAADRMKEKLKSMDTDPYLFEAKLNDIYWDAYREMNRMQELYDQQTKHGLNKEIQDKWNNLITDALSGNYQSLEILLGIGN
ncbi:DUF922 domain-containing Zn-dependent protease [Algoriphagus sp. AGSA1]|uniref:DUF922 domain-containing protein n=1 Tax=Algoriphagus sp. AGSA1 TaxID=2907213 RepID=UPI001F253115|nr:DUF922 domain-containing protein [Algoriphagus sp. AGSA1]MCE7055538.1 DUF922 domain-containing Zn-dependent protease [Algoriphagus sp. AGSA1]